MSSLILTSAELVVLVAMLGGLVRIRSLRPAALPSELDGATFTVDRAAGIVTLH